MPRSDMPLSVAKILALDAEYRRRAEAGDLKLIAPKENNPTGEAWLPVMYKRLDGARVTMLYSNTAAAHHLGKTRDWVVLYYKQLGPGPESQCTIVTEWHEGPLQGKRVVRGREDETQEFYSKARKVG